MSRRLDSCLLTVGLLCLLSVAPAASDEAPLQVGFLMVDGVYNSELMAPYDIFHHTVFHTKPGMEVFTVSPDGGNRRLRLMGTANQIVPDRAPPDTSSEIVSVRKSMGSSASSAFFGPFSTAER